MKNIAFGLIMIVLISACNGQTDKRSSEAPILELIDEKKMTRDDFVHEVPDIEIFNRIVTEHSSMANEPMNSILAKVGESLLNTPYVAHTLESADAKEKLTINLRELDCVTFVESAFAISLCIKQKTTEFEDFATQIEKIRYRNGEIKDYTSRLHYATEWLLDNQKKQLIKDITVDLGGAMDTRKINFMSTHTDAYQAFKADTSLISKIEKIENALSLYQRMYVPKENVAKIEKSIESGDILMLTTSVEGLDVSHFGMALRTSNGLHLLHASPNKGVIVSENTLSEYLKGIKSNTGIIVCRPVDKE